MSLDSLQALFIAPEDEHYLIGPCRLTSEGYAKLASYRLAHGGAAARTIHIRL